MNTPHFFGFTGEKLYPEDVQIQNYVAILKQADKATVSEVLLSNGNFQECIKKNEELFKQRRAENKRLPKKRLDFNNQK